VINNLQQQVHKIIWLDDVQPFPAWKQKIIRLLRIFSLVARDLSRGMLALRAMSLVYTTLLSFVPLLAVSFSVLKGFGVHNQVEPLLLSLLEPLGEKSIDITAKIVGFVENMKIGVLGAMGLGVLIYTVISLIHKIESAFNFTWRLNTERNFAQRFIESAFNFTWRLNTERNFAQRFSNYLSVIMVGPVLIFSAVGITATLGRQPIIDSIQSLPFAGDLIQLAGKLLPYVLIIAAFTFVYVLVPNTRVKIKSALYGAIVAGILWRWTGVLFASFATGSTNFTAIYSSFAILLLFMIWLYLGWLILLIGASISYYHQHPERLRWEIDQCSYSAVMQENLAFQLMLEIGSAFYQADEFIPTQDSLAKRLKIPHTMINRMLNNLEVCGLIVQVIDKESRYLPAQSIDQIKLIDILRVARKVDDNGLLDQLQKSSELDRMQQDMDLCQQQALANKSLQDLVLSNIE